MPSATTRRSTASAWTASRSIARPSRPACAGSGFRGLSRPARRRSRSRRPGDAIEVATGAVLPAGADAVIPLEEYERLVDVAEVRGDASGKPYRNVARRGSDSRARSYRCSRQEFVSALRRSRSRRRPGASESAWPVAARRGDLDGQRARRAGPPDRRPSGPRLECLRVARRAARARRHRRRRRARRRRRSRCSSGACGSTWPSATC